MARYFSCGDLGSLGGFMNKLYGAFALIFLTGCIADNNTRQTQGPSIDPITINVPKTETVNLDKVVDDTAARVSSDIKTEVSKNNSQLSGWINGMIHQLKTDIGKLFEAHVQATLNASNEMSANIRTNMSELIKAQISLSTQLQMQNKINAELRAELNTKIGVIEELKIANSSLKAEVKAQGQIAANAQIGKNTFEQQIKDIKQTFESKAGRDVNMYPPQAVETIKSTYHFFLGIIGALCTLATTIIGMSFKYSRQRAERRFELERKRSDEIHELLTSALVYVPKERAEQIETRMQRKHNG